MATPGRSCPLSYAYGPAALDRAPDLVTDTLWVAGGLYGNPFALDALLAAYEADGGDKALVFNGDFHWFDVDAADFARVNEAVLAHRATRGNVETELAAPQEEAGCGCGYPDWVGEETVERSNRIIERLRATARAHGGLERLARLPMHLVAQVDGARVAVVHGDAGSLAGWGFSQEALATDAGRAAAQDAFAAARVAIFASSHTCLPVLARFAHGVVANNGAAGMPNFAGAAYGIATRISVRPSRDALYRAAQGALFVEAIALPFDTRAWHERFLAQWPEGSPAHRSYWSRIAGGPPYRPEQAVRDL